MLWPFSEANSRLFHPAPNLAAVGWDLEPLTCWVWLKIKEEGLRRFWSMFPLTRVPFRYRFFEPPPVGIMLVCFPATREVFTASQPPSPNPRNPSQKIPPIGTSFSLAQSFPS